MSYDQVLQAIQENHFETAIAQLEPLLQENPVDPRLWQAKAVALLSLGQVDAAIVAAERAICLNPLLAAAHRLLGKAYTKLGDTQKAIAAYKQATRNYLEQQDKANAQACIAQIEQLRPQPAPPRLLVSHQAFLAEVAMKVQQGRYSEAFEDLNWLLQFEPNNVEALVQRALLQAKCHNYAAAVSDFALAMKLSPDDPVLRLQRGQMRLTIGDAHGAIADLSDLLKGGTVDPAQIYTLRGQAHQQLNDLENAFKDFSNALGINPDNADCYKARGVVYEAMEDLEEAVANYRQAAKLYLDQGNWTDHQALQHQIQSLLPKIAAKKEEANRIIRVPIKQFLGGSPVVEVLFNGCYSFDMVLDTGAGITCLTEAMARSLNVISIGTKRFRMADGWLVENPVGYVRSIALDRAQVDNLEVAIFSTAAEGLLGQNYLWRYDVRILRAEVELYLR